MKTIVPALVVIFLALVGSQELSDRTKQESGQKGILRDTDSAQNSHSQLIYTTKTVTLGQKNIIADVADTATLRTYGLSGRKSLAPDHGMLFVFEKPDRYGFWMKEMRFSIDMIWIGADKKVVHVEKNVSPETYPRVFEPSAAALYVLEVPAGFAEQNKVALGDLVNF